MSVNKVQLANGETIIDISDSTVTPETLAEGVTARDASGQKITGKMVPGGGKTVQTDWNQTDETAPDFLKNKPFGESEIVILEEQELTYVAEQGAWVAAVSTQIQQGDMLNIVCNGVAYNVEVKNFNGMAVFGNMGLAGFGVFTNEPFFGMYNNGMAMFMFEGTGVTSYTVKISVLIIEKIPEKFYDTKKTFYALAGSDGKLLLYADIAGTIPVTKDQAIIATQSGLVLISIDNFTVSVVSIMYANDYATLYAFVGGTGDSTSPIVFYTAEYAP